MRRLVAMNNQTPRTLYDKIASGKLLRTQPQPPTPEKLTANQKIQRGLKARRANNV